MNQQRFDRLTAALARTRRVLASFDALGDVAPFADGQRAVLILCAPDRFAAIAFSLGPGIESIGAMTATAALDFLAAREFDACVIDHSSAGRDVNHFLETARAEGILHGVPTVVLGGVSLEPLLLEAGATAVVGPESLGLRVLPLAAAARTARLARREMSALRDIAVRPGVSGLSGRELFEAHLADILANGEGPMGVALISIEGPVAAMATVSRLVRVLTRAEDVAAEIAPGRVALLLPGADGGDAQRVGNRLVAVAENSMVLDPATGEAVRPKASRIGLALAGFSSVSEVLAALDRRIGEALRDRAA